MRGLGRQNFSRSRLARRTLHTQPAVLKALHWNLLSVVPHARGVVENLFSTASGPVSTVLRSRSGAAFCCWLGTWFHTTLLCCNGPCPHDPPRCRLNSSPSCTYTPKGQRPRRIMTWCMHTPNCRIRNQPHQTSKAPTAAAFTWLKALSRPPATVLTINITFYTLLNINIKCYG